MKHLMKGIRIAAYIAEIIVAGSTNTSELSANQAGYCGTCREVWWQEQT